MTVTIKYQSQFSNDTLTSYTQQWATTHGDIKDTQAPGYAKDVGQFSGGGGLVVPNIQLAALIVVLVLQ